MALVMMMIMISRILKNNDNKDDAFEKNDEDKDYIFDNNNNVDKDCVIRKKSNQ